MAHRYTPYDRIQGFQPNQILEAIKVHTPNMPIAYEPLNLSKLKPVVVSAPSQSRNSMMRLFYVILESLVLVL